MMADADQRAIRVVIARGGTSRGLYLHERDLPPPGVARDRLLARLMGSPDLLQIDGLGGSRPITSKVAIVARSTRADVDVDYTFAQVDIATAGVGYQGNCGNISAGVGPFAIDEGLVEAREGMTEVRIFNTNSQRLLVAGVPVHGGRAAVCGDFVVPGVPGSGAEITMNWAATVGTATGSLLPTGRPVDRIELENGGRIEASLFDAANPCVWVRGHDLGLIGDETQDAINGNARLLQFVREVRGKAAVLFGLVGDWREAEERAAGLPMLGLLSPPIAYRTINGEGVAADAMDLRVHLIFMGVLHESIAGTGSICLAAAARTPDSIAHGLAINPDAPLLRIGHPSGVTPTRVRASHTAERPHVRFDELGFSRTARRIMAGEAYYPAGLLG
ncbi:PrpF domain-containing protein [Sphingomonas sp. TREG-RG-20F-R18-01]|uniref:2-methylaconitate cis-trans isomerase PrpF family protein n=1 Tax=Sphingomonas sp. TREG-RG-20F-R18-01 TaxID=2914982 RepID=UPI001F59FE4B|nr:PrpF domain-containing protein [Sphingomonas sp. TREG-RG-20F-R18-01]